MKRIFLFTMAWMSCFLSQAQLSVYYAIPAPTGNWTNYVIPLTETAGWTMGSPGGPAPDALEFQGILSSLNGLSIRFNSNAQIFFDNVSLANLVSSTFPACTTDGWMIGDNRGAACNSLIGNPPGSVNNGVAPAVFDAPAKYLGNQAAAYGGNLTFDLNGSPGILGYVILTAAPNPADVPASGVLLWGDNYSGQSSFPVDLTNVTQLAGGRYYSLALRTDGTVTECGWNTYPAPDFLLGGASQLSPSLTNVPMDLTNAVAVASGAYHNLALKTDGTVAAWGNTTFGQTNLPPGLSNVVAVACGDYHSLALTSGGNVVVWGATNVTHEGGGGGSNSFGISIVPAGLSNVVAIAGGAFHCLALKSDGTMIGWGRNNGGQTNVPSGLTNVVAIAAGSYHNLALRDDGTVAAWGTNSLGQTNVPPGLSNVVAITAGNYFSLALKADGTVVAWGDHTFVQTNVPAGLSNVTAIAGGGYHSLALIGNGPPLLQIALSNPTLDTNGFGVSVPSQCGRVFRLEFKDSLADADWTALPLAAGNGGILNLTDPSLPISQRFYRVRRW